MRKTAVSFAAAIVMTLSMALPALAQDSDDAPAGNMDPNAGPANDNTTPDGTAPTAPEDLPTPKSDDDPAPATAAVGLPAGGIVSQAGIGGPVAYGRRGVLELGGSASFARATDFTEMSIGPSIGWFLTDNLELSALTSLRYAKAGSESRTQISALIEPSYHVPLSRSLFVFGGLGAGLGYSEGSGSGFAIAPRIGINAMVGRSGIITPAAFFEYTTSDAVETPQGTLLAVSTTFGMQVGYTVMW